MKKLTEQQKVRRQILFNMPYLLLTFLILVYLLILLAIVVTIVFIANSI